MNVFPAIKNYVLINNGVDELFRKFLANGAAMFVIHNACRLIQHLPAALPGGEAQVCIFVVEGPEDLVESAQLQKLPAVKGAGAAAGVRAGERNSNRRINMVTGPKTTPFPPNLGQSCFFATARRVRKKDLAGHGEHQRIRKRLEERKEKICFHPHIIVQQNNNIVFGSLKPKI